MNIIKHMEAVFVATVALAVSGSYLVDALPEAHAKTPVQARVATQVPVVVVTAKRMSAAEKQQALQAEADHAASRI